MGSLVVGPITGQMIDRWTDAQKAAFLPLITVAHPSSFLRPWSHTNRPCQDAPEGWASFISIPAAPELQGPTGGLCCCDLQGNAEWWGLGSHPHSPAHPTPSGRAPDLCLLIYIDLGCNADGSRGSMVSYDAHPAPLLKKRPWVTTETYIGTSAGCAGMGVEACDSTQGDRLLRPGVYQKHSG